MLPPLAGCSEIMYIWVVNCAEAASDKTSEAERGDLGSHCSIFSHQRQMSLLSLPQSKQKTCSCSALLQHFFCLSLKALHHYPLWGSFLPRLGDSGWPEQVQSLLRFRHCRLERILEAHVCDDRGAHRRMEWGSEWEPQGLVSQQAHLSESKELLPQGALMYATSVPPPSADKVGPRVDILLITRSRKWFWWGGWICWFSSWGVPRVSIGSPQVHPQNLPEIMLLTPSIHPALILGQVLGEALSMHSLLQPS